MRQQHCTPSQTSSCILLTMPKLARRSSARLSPYLRGVIFGMSKAGKSAAHIQRAIKKPDGAQPSHQAVADAIALCTRMGGMKWDGVVQTARVGRHRSTELALDRKIRALVFRHRGRAVVTAAYIRKKLPESRAVSLRTITRRLGEAGLASLRSRRWNHNRWTKRKPMMAALNHITVMCTSHTDISRPPAT